MSWPNANFRTAKTSIASNLAEPAAKFARAPYRGRFAPSPTGPLHFGSLVAAIASYAQALIHDGQWLLRIEDIDPPREVPGAADAIIDSLAVHGFRWHGEVIYQSDKNPRFHAVVAELLQTRLAYACACSREEIRRTAASGATGPVYPGTCRDKSIAPGEREAAIRVRTAGAHIAFDDLVQGRIRSDVERKIGDFVIRRRDGLIAYSLAVVVDDHDEAISEIVRGADLLPFTAAQIHLQQVLGLRRPRYCHVPVVKNQAGEKLSKQTGAEALDDKRAAANLVDGLKFLGQQPPTALARGGVADIWDWVRKNWRIGKRNRTDKPMIQNQ